MAQGQVDPGLLPHLLGLARGAHGQGSGWRLQRRPAKDPEGQEWLRAWSRWASAWGGRGAGLLQCSHQLPPGSGHWSCPHRPGGAAVRRRGCGVLKATMLWSPPPRDHCRRWGQTERQTLGRGSWNWGLTPPGPPLRADPTPTLHPRQCPAEESQWQPRERHPC